MLHPAARIARRTFVDGLTGCRLWVGDGLDLGGYPRIAVRFPDGRERPVTVARVVE